VQIFTHRGAVISEIPQKQYHNNIKHVCRRNWKTRASYSERFPPFFLEKEYIGQLTLKRPIFLSNQKFEIPSFEN